MHNDIKNENRLRKERLGELWPLLDQLDNRLCLNVKQRYEHTEFVQNWRKLRLDRIGPHLGCLLFFIDLFLSFVAVVVWVVAL